MLNPGSAEEVALRGGVLIAGHTPSVVEGPGIDGEAQCGGCPPVADGGEALVLYLAVEHDELLSAGTV
jgi:hypothetical protein